MINPLALIAAPLAACSFVLPQIHPADLWAMDADLSAAELSSLLEECTWHTLEETTEDGELVYYLRTPTGERDGLPWHDLADARFDLAPMIDEALCHE